MKELSVNDLQFNPFTSLSKDWMLLTAGTKETGFNTMTISWGHFGALWENGGGAPTAIVYVRKSRYTKEFMEREERFTISCFAPEYKKQLAYLGSHSGRDEDKIAKAGLTPCFGEGFTSFEEANLVFVCKKLYHADITKEGFCDPAMFESFYGDGDIHTMYIGEITQVLGK